MSDLYARQPSWTDYLPAEWQSAINRSPVVNALTGYLNRRPSDIEGASNKIFGQPGDREAQDRNWLLQQAQGPSALERMNPVAQDGANKLMLLANFFGPGVKLPPAAPKPTGIRAYHGSPHDFDKFDISKIGTGEGAQAYGRGLYFAENEGVARSYRDRLKKTTVNGNPWSSRDPEHVAAGAVNFTKGDLVAAKQYLFDNINFPGHPPELRKIHQDALAILETKGPPAMKQDPGRMYEVNIKADPDQFLDWDKPLAEQGPKVREVIQKMAPSDLDYFLQRGKNLPGGGEGRDFLYALRSKLLKGTDEAVAAIHEAGIPGIKYLDQQSRVAGHGSRNYVVFDDKLIEILRKYGLLPPVAAGTAAALNQQEPQL